MEGIKTIDEFSIHFWNENPDSTIETISKKTAKQMAIEFAKYHVGLALDSACEKAKVIDWNFVVDEGSVLNAYPLSNIK